MFLKSYKDNCTTLILRNKASALKLNFKSILNTYRAGKMSNRNFVEIFFTEQAKNICKKKTIPSSFRTVVPIALRMYIALLIISLVITCVIRANILLKIS